MPFTAVNFSIISSSERFSTSTEIVSTIGFGNGHVSDILMCLMERELMECKNLKARKGRLYVYIEEEISTMALLKKIEVKS